MKIECLTSFKDQEFGEHVEYRLGDICTVSDNDTIEVTDSVTGKKKVITKGEYYCGNGWAKDLDGKVETGEPLGGATTLQVHNLTLGQKAPAAGA